jgi:hypothetical protein
MRTLGLALAAIRLGLLLRPVYAYADPVEHSTGTPHEFDDESSLSSPAPETRTIEVDTFAHLGVRAAAARLELQSRSETGASVLALAAVDVARSSFERRALSWGYSDELLFNLGLGYGFGAEGAFHVGPLLTTDDRGSGAFVRFGAEGDSRVSRPGAGSLKLSRAFANVPIGFRLRGEAWRVEAAVLPSLGGIALSDEDRLSGPLWFGQRLRARFGHVQLKLERNETDSVATATHAGAELCAVARRPAVVACTFFESFDRESAPRASFSEVGISLGIGSYWTTTREEGYSDPILRMRTSR